MTKSPPPPASAADEQAAKDDQYAADLAAANHLADKVFWEVFGPRQGATLQ